MDDYNITTLYESQNEWVARLVNILTPEIIYGFREMLKEAIKLCNNNNESDKYLMTFQNFMARVPKWNESMVINETQRIMESSGCAYLNDLVSCVHIIQLKCLSCIRVGQKTKTVDIDIPKLSVFIHQIYINASRKLYKNVYLFEQKITPLEYQRNQNMLEIMIKECIVNSIRDNVPVDKLLKVYLENQDEEELIVNEEIIEEKSEGLPKLAMDNIIRSDNKVLTEEKASIDEPIELEPLQLNVVLDDDVNSDQSRYRPTSAPGRLTFSDIDSTLNENNVEEQVEAPKSIERLEKISEEKYIKRVQEEAYNDVEDELERIQIDNEPVNFESLGLIELL